MGTPSVLVVEDEPAIQELVSFTCSNDGYAVRRAGSARAAADAILDELPDLVVLDWLLPDRAGVDLLRDLRRDERTRSLPIVLLTARNSEQDRVEGLDAGADDYLAKPFSPRELVARLRAVLRRRSPAGGVEGLIYGPLSISAARHEVRLDGQVVRLGLAEFKVLKFLAAHPERVFSRSQLLENIWGNHVLIDERTVDVHMLRLRKALTPVNGRHLIKTVRGLGYLLSTQTD